MKLSSGRSFAYKYIHIQPAPFHLKDSGSQLERDANDVDQAFVIVSQAEYFNGKKECILLARHEPIYLDLASAVKANLFRPYFPQEASGL